MVLLNLLDASRCVLASCVGQRSPVCRRAGLAEVSGLVCHKCPSHDTVALVKWLDPQLHNMGSNNCEPPAEDPD